MLKILMCREEGVAAFWKGNGTNIIRIFPYSAAQLSANDFYKRMLATDGELTVAMRLTAGACAGMTATALTHPLDTVRLRLALPSHPYAGVSHPTRAHRHTHDDLPVSICPVSAAHWSVRA